MSDIDNFLGGNDTEGKKKPSSTGSQVDDFLSDAPAQDKGLGGHLKDAGLSLAQGIISVPESAVGLADIPTGGRVGKFLENEDGLLGFRPKQAREYLDEFNTEKSKAQQQEFADADGILAKTGVALSNPSMIANTLAESAPSIGLGAGLGRGVMAGANAVNKGRTVAALSAAEKAAKAQKAGALAGATGEGLVMAGAQAEAIRGETEDGLLTPAQSGYALGTGGLGMLFGYGGAKLSQRLGIGDIDTLLTQGAKRADIDSAIAQEIAKQPAKSIPRNVIEGAITEGFLEELPQSVSEQILQNLALDKDWAEGVDEAIVMGTLAGMAMGAGAGGYSGLTKPSADTGDQGAQGYNPNQPPADMPPSTDMPSPAAPSGFSDPAMPATSNQEISQPVEAAPVPVVQPLSEQMGIDPNSGPMSTAAALAVDSGATEALAVQAAQQQAVTQAGTLEAAAAKAQPAPQGVDTETGEIVAPAANAVASSERSVQQQAPEDRAGQLEERIGFIQQQAKNTGWDKSMLAARDEAQAELDSIKPPVPAQIPVAEPLAKQAAAPAASDIKAITAKQIPQMTDAELQQAADYYGPDHKRTAKLNREIAKRGITAPAEVNTNGIETTQAEQASTQRTQAPTAAGTQSAEPVAAATEEFTTVKTVYGDSVVVRSDDLASGKTILKTFTKDGKPKAGKALNRENIDSDGSKNEQRIKDESANPLFDTVTKQDGTPFANKIAAGREMNKRGLLDTHEVTKVDGGYIVSKKQQKEERSVATPTYEQAKADVDAARDRGREASKVMDTFPVGEMGLTPDAVKATPEWKKAKAESEAAFAQEQAANKFMVKNFKKENAEAIQSERSRKLDQSNLQGKDIDGNWAEFSKESGTLSIPRAEMPQIKAEHRGAMVNFLNARGITHQEESVPAASLKPTQAEFSREKVAKAKDYEGGNRSILVSGDGHVLDGHHQWMASREAGEDVKVIRLDAPIAELLDAAREFPSSTVDASTATAEPNILKAAKELGKLEVIAVGDSVKEKAESVKKTAEPVKEKAEKEAIAEKDAERFAGNKLFTSDAVAKARERMRSKLGQLNSGIDPELLVDGMTIAGAYIESGVRKFSDYAKAMVEDLGDGVKPYLLSFWEGARNYPGLDTEGMTSPTVSRIQFEAMTSKEQATEVAPEAVGVVAEKPAKRTRKTGAKGDMVLTQDWGVSHIDGYGDSNEREIGNDTKDAFLKETRTYLNAVADALRSHGYEPHLDRRGKAEKPVSVNESGVAGSGDVSLVMQNPDNGNKAYITIGDTSLRGVVPSTESGIAIMYRVGTGEDRYASKHGNTWAPVDLSANELAAMVSGKAQNKAEVQNERGTVHTDGTQALGEVATEAGGAAEGGRRAGVNAENSGSERTGATSGADAAGVQGARSGGSSAERVRSTEAGSGSNLKPKAKQTPKQKAAEKAIGEDTRPEVAGEPASAPNIPALDYRITEDTGLGIGGEVAKFNDNLAAIRTLKKIESENRRATPEEQATLARYVGWGGLANAFPDPASGKFKTAWDKRGPELRDLLDKDEYAAARRSTRNAHYTAKPVVEAMWKMVERLGFKGGLALETSMGSGNFLGLKPQGTPASFVGIEYDSLTARMGQALYPQATVLHSGFQDVALPDNSFALSIGNPPFGSESLRFQYKPELNGVSIHNQFFRASMDSVRPGGLQAMVVSRYLMDAKDKGTRLALAADARLVAAFRLPDNAFKENARTEVVTDIIILQKYTAEEAAAAREAVEAYRRRPERSASAEGERLRLASQVPSWVETTEIADPLGGDAMTVNKYFTENKQNIMGVLERSGSMQFGADITVRLDDPSQMTALLEKATQSLPENIHNMEAEVLRATEARHKSLSDGLRIALAGNEVGHVQKNRSGKLERIIERETPEGSIEMSVQEITKDSPWSEQLGINGDGQWYRTVVKKDDAGKSVKILDKDGKPTRYNVTEREVFENEADVPDTLRLGNRGYARLEASIGLRDMLKRQLILETSDAAKGVMEGNRKELAKAYDAFVKEFGPVNRPVNLSLLMTMPDGGLVAALEVEYQAGVTAEQAEKTGRKARPEESVPAPIMSSRVIPKYEPATTAATASDALAITLGESGRVDIPRIAALRGISEQEAIKELQASEKPLAFEDPETGTWETADVYLSGQVKRKLNAARELGMKENVKALEEVQPTPWTAEDVTAMIGSSWVPEKVYSDFANHLSGGDAKVRFSPLTNTFTIAVSNQTAVAKSWSSDGADVSYLLSRLLNSQPIVVRRTDSDGNSYIDREATTLAQLKGKEISEEFLDWVFKDGDRRSALVEIFNEKFNTRVIRQRDGSHMKMPGKVPDSIIAMRRHQNNATWRGITERFMLMDHTVGAGKTFTAIARAMERRRMGLSKKPMIVVPNHLIDQWTADIYRLYPGAKVLAAGKKDFEAKRRRRLFGKIATGDWDIVLVPHSSFGFIGIDKSTEQRFLEQEMAMALEAVKDAQEQADEDGTNTGRSKPFGVKEAERLIEKIQARMDGLNDVKKDKLLTFEQMGVDDLTVDEAHEFKNLYYSSRMTGVRGMGDKTGSRKANDLYNKVRVLSDNKSASVTFLTGTPISNSAVEMYTMMRYLAADQLKEMGLEHFDAWRAQFVEASAAFEPTESGSLKEVTRLGRSWSNMRSLMDLYYEFTDAVSLEDIQKWYSEDNGGKEFPVPKVKGGDRQLVAIQPTAAQEQMLTNVIAGFDSLDGITDPYERNAERLRLMDRARKISLDARAVDRTTKSDEKGGKLERASQEIKRIYDGSTADKGTQLVFLDRSVPNSKGDDKIIKEYDALVATRDKAMAEKDDDAFDQAQEALDKYDANEIAELREAMKGGWNAYQQIKDNLIAMGIPAHEIRFIQDANNDEQKKALFEAVNNGEVRVLIGSSQRMGAGTNAQKRMVGLHHIDVTWKPSDIEQREGRIIRQGNLFATPPTANEPNPLYRADFEVEILAYATERTVDAKMWDLNATKLRTINGIRKYDGAFSMEFADEESVSMAEMAALASGNPLLLERVKTESEINLLELQERAFRRRMYSVQDSVHSAERAEREYPQRIEQLKEQEQALSREIEGATDRHEARTVNVEGKDYGIYREAMAAVQSAIELQQAGKPTARYSISINGTRVSTKEAIETAVGSALGDVEVFEIDLAGKAIFQRTAAARDLAPQLTKMIGGMGDGDTRSETVATMLGMDVVADATAYQGMNGTEIDLSLSLVDGKGRTTASAAATPIAPDGSYSTNNIRAPLTTLFAAAQRIATNNESGRLQGQLERSVKDLPALREKAAETFPKAAELEAKRARLKELVSELDGKGLPVLTKDSSYEVVSYAASPEGPWSVVTQGGFAFANTQAEKFATVDEAVEFAKNITGKEPVARRKGWSAENDGVKFSFAGQTARGADVVALDNAKVRIASGDDAETVRQETGWHRGDDGKWRFEISDDQAKLRVAGKTAGEVIDSAALDAITGNRKFPVTSDLIDHAQLFVAYPKLSNIKVEKMPAGGTALARLQRRATGFTIQLRESMPRDKVTSAILHELQHGIQVYEGFAVGGSKNIVFSDFDLNGAKAYRLLAGEVEARNTQTRQTMTPNLRRNIAPEFTQDTLSADVLVTFNGKDITSKALPNNASMATITNATLVRAFDVQFPRLGKAVRTMLARGNKGERGGVVVIDSADPLLIARAFSQKTGKPISQSVKMFSDAGVINGFFDPKSGLTFLVGPNLNPVTGTAVLLHEMVHGQQRQKIDKAALRMLMNRESEKNAELRSFLDRVAARMVDAGETANAQEAGAYIVEQAIMEAKSEGYGTADSRFLSWVDQNIGKKVGDFLRLFIGNVRSWMLRNGMPIGTITVDDLVSYAMAGMEQASRGNVDGAAGFSSDAITNTPNFKRWFGDSKVVDGNGKPLIVHHGSGTRFTVFDKNKLGSTTGADSAKEGFFFTSEWNLANMFRRDTEGSGVDLAQLRRVLADADEKVLQRIGEDFGYSLDVDLELEGREYFVDAVIELYEKDVSLYTAFDDQNGMERILKNNLGREFFEPGAVLDVYLKIEDPYVFEFGDDSDQFDEDAITNAIKEAKRLGKDGVILKNMVDSAKTDDKGNRVFRSDVYVVFEPTQIKSATDNNGDFDGANPDIRYSRSGFKGMASKATYELNKTFNAPGKLSKWHTTVGTMNNLAQRSKEFKPVFEAAQGFIDDVAYYAADAAELAGKLLPKLETWKDIAKKPISAADNAAIEKPINEGTLVWTRDASGKPVRVENLATSSAKMSTEEKARELMDRGMLDAGMNNAWKGQGEEKYAKLIDSRYESKMLKAGIVWTPVELKSMFGLTDDQVVLYQEFRAAVDRSLDTMGRADMLRFGGEDLKPLRQIVMDEPDIQSAARLLIAQLTEMSRKNPDRETQLMQTAHGIMERAAKVAELQADGYAPLSRFGKYTIDVVENGERQYFGLFETVREANAMAEKMRAEFGADSVTQGTLSDESYKLFAGITPESLELFGNMLGLDSDGDTAQDQAFQEYLRLTKTNRSAMRRLIHRKGIAGFSSDVGRVLASFVYSNARQTSAGLNMGDLGDAISKIPKQQGELTDVAVRLAEYIKNPQEEAQAVRGLLFAQYLGGSVASAFVNITQPFAVTFPWLSQHGGARKAAAEIARAAKDMSTKGKKYEADLAAALKAAEDDGTVSPQEVHQLMAQARGSGSLGAGDGTRIGDARAAAKNSVARLSLAWGKLFGAAEQVNRRVTFIAAYRVARDQNMENPAEFAREAVRETQFIYSKANKMQWGRGAVGGTLMTFKTYSIAYVELMHRLWNQGEKGSPERKEGRKAAMLMIATLLLMGGAGGLPFAEDAEDLIDGAAQLMGYNFSARKAKEQFLIDVFGDALAEFVDKGVSGLPGSPMDVSGRLGLGNLIPGTGLFTERTSHSRDLLEIAGPAGDLASRALSGTKKILGGDIGAGVTDFMPTAVRNAMKGADMASTGMYRDTKGYNVLETSHLEAALKAMGFQPKGVSKVQEANWLNQREKNFYNMKAQEIRAQWAAGIFEKDAGKVQAARDAVDNWNRKNPDQRIVIRIPDVMRRVREMAKSKDQRIADTAPKAMRARMREEAARIREGLN